MCSLTLQVVLLFATISARVYAAIGPVADLNIVNAEISPDGYLRNATLVNNNFPGPLIKAEKNDQFKLNVINSLTDLSMDLETSIHWHGISKMLPVGLMVCLRHSVSYYTKPELPLLFSVFEQTVLQLLSPQTSDNFPWYFRNDPHGGLYDVDDDDTVITLADWYHYSSKVAPMAPEFNATLINGKGRYIGGPKAPLAVVNVKQGLRYRLRIVSISCEPAFTFSIDGHQLTIIEADSNNVRPLLVDSLEIFPGQRYSAVLDANQSVDNYWIRALPPLDANKNPVHGGPYPGGADININLNVTFVTYRPSVAPNMSGAQNASDLVPAGSIYGLDRNKSVEITIPAGVPHPIHLHGHAFHVVRSAGTSTYNYVDPVIRDVVSLGGETDNVTIRFFTDNPGPWLLHCHINWHLEMGFAVVFAEDVPEIPMQNNLNGTYYPSGTWPHVYLHVKG
ncbi:multicopper oxidase-domain-containing protein [Lactifluus volemus]|nr:multicopper oxidase-domain-containing protein [Lactifluus volemus]